MLLLRAGSLLPSLNLDFAGSGLLDSRITFTRASTATFVGSNGLIQTATSGTARFGYDPSTLVSLGLLIEEARTNLCLWSNDATNVVWIKTTCTTAQTATGADGVANSATTLTATAGNALCLQTIVSVSAERATSAWVKRRTGSGTINMTCDNGVTWTVVTVTAAWTKVTIPVQTLVNPTVGWRIVTNADAIDVQYFQCENDSTNYPGPTSSTATTSATATRAAETASMTGSNFTSWYNPPAGTFVVTETPPGDYNQIGPIFTPVSAGFSDRFEIFKADSTATVAGKRYSALAGAGPTTITKSTDNDGSTTKLAIAGATNDFVLVVNGVIAASSASLTMPSPTSLTIGSLNNMAWFNGFIGRIRYYPARLPNVTIQALTT